MAITINPNRINIAPGTPGKDQAARREGNYNASPVVTPKRAQENIIPSQESLRTLVTSAVEALKQGVRWDRGTILNVVV